MTLNIICPSCGNTLELPDEAMGNKANCAICKHVFVVMFSEVQAKRIHKTPDANSKSVPNEIDSRTMVLLLNIIEAGLRRMIVGIPRFFVVSIERICSILLQSMPVFVRLVRVLFLGLVLALIVLGPLLLTWPEYYWPSGVSVPVLDPEMLTWLSDHIAELRFAAVIWLVLSVCGALWGLIHVHRKHRAKDG